MEPKKNNFKIVSDKKARIILPNAITLIGVCIGLTSIKFAIDGKFAIAIIAILFAGLMDALDGRIARLIKGTSKMGKELDSLGDVISFGVAPAGARDREGSAHGPAPPVDSQALQPEQSRPHW